MKQLFYLWSARYISIFPTPRRSVNFTFYFNETNTPCIFICALYVYVHFTIGNVNLVEIYLSTYLRLVSNQLFD